MKSIAYYKVALMLATFILLFIACSKNDETPPLNNNQKTKTINDKVFTDDPFGYIFTNYNGLSNFANNTGNTEFTGSNPPGFGGGSSTTGSGSFTYLNEFYPLKYSGFEKYSNGWFYLIFLDVPIGNSDYQENFNGIVFEIRSGSDSEITIGDYYFSLSEEPFTFDFGVMGVHVNTVLEEQYEFTSGTISISKSGDIYNFLFAGFLENGKAVSGYFYGSLTNLAPEPNPTSFMSAKVNGIDWNATLFYAEINNDYDVLKIYGENFNGKSIEIKLFSNHMAAYYVSNGIIYPSNEPNIIITENTGTNISGTFSFAGYDWETNTGGVNITNGKFFNIPITETQL